MKKIFIEIRGATLKAFASSVALIALMAFVLPQTVYANMAANTKIINSAKASYNDGTGLKETPISSVTVTVTLVETAPGVAVTGGDQTTAYTGTDTVLTNTFTVTANSNGPDTYALTPNMGVQSNNSSGGSFGTVSPAGPITLGATITLSGSTATVLNVPSDGTADSKINEIQAGDTVVINVGGTDYDRTVAAPVTDTGLGTQTITLTVALPGAPTVGTLVREQQTVTVQVKSGTIQTAGTSIEINKTLSAESQTGTKPTGTSGNCKDTYTNGIVTFKKYVRNTATVCSTGSTVAFNTHTYCDSGVTATPGQTLEYLMVITNSGTGSVSAATVTDTVPVDYVDWVVGSIFYWDETNTSHALTDAAADDAGKFVSPTLTVNVGGTTPPTLPAAGGTIANGDTVHVVYQAAVK